MEINGRFDRKHLIPIIKELMDFTEGAPYAKVLLSLSEEENIGFLSKNTAKFFGLPAKSPVMLKKRYLLHMDNSGHFTGAGHGKTGHNDRRPLKIGEILSISEQIRKTPKDRVLKGKNIRGCQRYSILTDSARRTIICVERGGGELILVTAYNPREAVLAKIIRELEKQKSH